MELKEFRFLDLYCKPKLLISIITSSGRINLQSQGAELAGTFANGT